MGEQLEAEKKRTADLLAKISQLERQQREQQSPFPVSPPPVSPVPDLSRVESLLEKAMSRMGDIEVQLQNKSPSLPREDCHMASAESAKVAARDGGNSDSAQEGAPSGEGSDGKESADDVDDDDEEEVITTPSGLTDP